MFGDCCAKRYKWDEKETPLVSENETGIDEETHMARFAWISPLIKIFFEQLLDCCYHRQSEDCAREMKSWPFPAQTVMWSASLKEVAI